MIIGVDEAGRGPLAGPVVAAAVVLCDGGIPGLNDSKMLTAKRRAALETEIKARCLWAVGEASVEEIDALNILQATMLAMTRAVEGLLNSFRHPELVSGSMDDTRHQRGGLSCDSPWMLNQVQHDEIEEQLEILIDGNMTPLGRVPVWRWPARAIIGGDASEPAISAASIIAKEHRDRMMVAADAAWPHYGFARHKGYGTAEHMAALHAHGPSPVHRMSFAPCRQFPLPV